MVHSIRGETVPALPPTPQLTLSTGVFGYPVSLKRTGYALQPHSKVNTCNGRYFQHTLIYSMEKASRPKTC